MNAASQPVPIQGSCQARGARQQQAGLLEKKGNQLEITVVHSGLPVDDYASKLLLS